MDLLESLEVAEREYSMVRLSQSTALSTQTTRNFIYYTVYLISTAIWSRAITSLQPPRPASWVVFGRSRASPSGDLEKTFVTVTEPRVALVACLIPAYRATRVAPAEALKE